MDALKDFSGWSRVLRGRGRGGVEKMKERGEDLADFFQYKYL